MGTLDSSMHELGCVDTVRRHRLLVAKPFRQLTPPCLRTCRCLCVHARVCTRMRVVTHVREWHERVRVRVQAL